MLRQRFPGLQEDVKQVKAYYSLEAWSSLIDPEYEDDYSFPAAIRVHKRGDGYQLTTYFYLAQIRGDRRAALMLVAEQARKSVGRPKPRLDADWVPLYEESLGAETAVEQVLVRLGELQIKLQPLL